MTTLLATLAIAKAFQGQDSNPNATKQTKGDNPLFKQAMEDTKFTYTISKSGLSYVVEFSVKDLPNRIVWVTRETNVKNDIATQSIYTEVWSDKGAPPVDVLVKTVLRPAKKIGNYYVMKFDDGFYAIRFMATFDLAGLEASGETRTKAIERLKDTIYFVNQVGEETEKEIREK
jgi:hypothetical protein